MPSKAKKKEGPAPAERFQLAVESAPNGIVMTGPDGEIVLVNRKAEELFGYSSAELMGQTVDALVPASARRRHQSHRSKYMAHPEARPMGGNRELFGCRKDGSTFPVEVGLTPVQTDEGQFILGVIVDITERKRAEAAMRRQALVLQNVHDAVFLVDGEHKIQTWNQGAEQVYGYELGEIVGREVSELFPKHDRKRIIGRILSRTSRSGKYETVARCRHRDGHAITVSLRTSSLPAGENGPDEGIVFCVNDITHQKELESQILEVSENEQRRIGQDIHDDLCQQLAGIGCLAKALEQQLDRGDADATRGLSEIGRMVAEANTRAREIARGLVPAVLESQGLDGALEKLAERTQRVYGVACEFENSVDLSRLQGRSAVQLYRIAQEAVSNSVRHGDATRIYLSVQMKAGDLVLSIKDDGIGMAAATARPTGMGLHTMARRAQLLGGELDVHSTARQGTEIRCIISFPGNLFDTE